MENFSSLDQIPEENIGVASEDTRKAAKRERLKEMSKLLSDTLNQDPTFLQRHKALSNSVIVVNTLGYGEGGNIVVDEVTKNLPKDQRRLVPTSQIVGYRVKNVGNVAIKYLTEEYVQNKEDGTWVGNRVQKVLEPGEVADLTRKYMTIFCAQPEISFQLANGKIVRGSSTVKPGDVEGELEAHYFTFNNKEVKVNSDEVKLNIATKKKQADGTFKWVVKPEFEKTFGYLNNPKLEAGRSRRAGSKKERFSTQDVAANYINRLIEEAGLIPPRV